LRVAAVEASTGRSDEELLKGCRRGDESAWEALVARYQRLIYTLPRRAGLDEDAASEIFQDVFAALLESIATIEQPSRLQAWLVTTAKRKTWRAVSRAKSLRPFADDAEEPGAEMYDIPDERVLPDEELVRLEEQHLVRAALGELDGRCRSLIQMLFYAAEPPPYSEIAAALGTSEGSIGPTRARCLKKLLDVLRKKGFS
jgi:RNA polymerase sigma factor (sigma-70 family)